MRVDSRSSGSGLVESAERTVASGPEHAHAQALQKTDFLGFLLAILAAFSMWYYVHGVLIPCQQADAARTGQPRGNQSDLYPAWLATHEFLLHGRNPYSAEVTRDIQRGYWGRTLDRPHDPKDQARFAYPLYVIFLLAPVAIGSFHAVRPVFAIVLALLTGLSVLLWTRAFGIRVRPVSIAIILLAMMGTFPVFQGLVLQQLTLLVAALLAASAAALAGGQFAIAGALLAVASIKPHLVFPVVLWLLVWSLTDWRKRRNFIFGFSAAMAVLLLASEIALPGWFAAWWNSLRAYIGYHESEPLLILYFGRFLGTLAEYALIAATALVCWRSRREIAGSLRFGFALALLLTTVVLTTPVWHTYDQIFLLPAAIWIAFNWKRGMVFHSIGRLIYILAALIVGGGSVAALALTCVSFWSPATALRWQVAPLAPVIFVPIAILFALILPGFNLNPAPTARQNDFVCDSESRHTDEEGE